jgi:acetylornithine deacetylase/succinyl-diaminopimelate desuccinylase-like protein
MPETPSQGRLAVCEPLFEYISDHFEDYISELIGICEVPAPTFQEQRRAEHFASLFRALGCGPVVDAAGNVEVPFLRNGSPHVVLSAHLDTVFPFDSICVKREGTLLRAPGISDDSAGLAAVLMLCRAMRKTGFQPRGSITVLATVGEEGLGNLRGIKHFFERARGIDYFLSLDGCDAERIVTRGLASKRLRIFFRGPGGHSWGDAGTPNPIHASGELLSRIHRATLPKNPKTSINVGMISGGTSINAIPVEMHMDVDLRSESAASLAEAYQFVTSAQQESLYANTGITSEAALLGERPSGGLRDDHPLVRTAMAANRHFNLEAHLDIGSTDSNIPFSLGIPALTLGVGGKSGKIHTPEEWYDYQEADRGLKRIAMLLSEILHESP